MKHIIIPIFLILAISCKSKKDTGTINESKQEEMKISEKLESFGFFDLMENEQKIETYKTIVEAEFSENGWLKLPNNYLITHKLDIKEDEDILTADYRSAEVEGTSMYNGNLLSNLKDFKVLFHKRNIEFKLGEEDMVWGDKRSGNHPFKHTVDINGKSIIFFDGNLDDRNANNPQIYVENTIRILNQELELMDSKERFFILTGLECVYYVLADDKMLTDFKSIENEIGNKIIEL
ncbi:MULTISPECIES: hypothetical protein [unclassified Cellulophaga]|uniref:hypothetical protein n=1 Tax=unclassified Cellulophaga TaxID=2634405 RepID=UPI001C4F39DC|nr:hypothetical protein [Cellulophaga sp. HaHa_2_1]QXP52857.1 hypothetical protein H0I24_02725 [Cellulophaga sp. HaHa_2_1]